MKSRIFILFFTFVSIYIICNREEYKSNLFAWDKSGYYLYLPAVFIYHDLEHLQFYKQINQKYHTSGDDDSYSLSEQPAGKRLNKYPAGTALFELPFFLVAHSYCLLTTQYAADGYTLPYQWAGLLSNIFWVMIGLFFLRAFLRRYFNDSIVAFTLLCIAFGTNLYNYTAFDQGMSHPYSFLLFAAVLYFTDAWYRHYKPSSIYWLGATIGLVAITRPVNLVIVLLPLLWGVHNLQSFKDRLLSFRKNIKYLLIAGIIFILVSLIQMYYWKAITGHWLYYSYQGEGFNFSKPEIWKGLFGFRKGWFIYTPIAFIGMLGFFALWRKEKRLAPSLILFFVTIIYVVFSWRQWWYGGSFGCRPLVEALAVLSLPLAAGIEYIFSKQKFIINKLIFTIVILFFVFVNLFQTYQFSFAVIHWDRMTEPYYWRVFLKQYPAPSASHYLMSDQEYRDALKEMNR